MQIITQENNLTHTK